MSLCSPSNPPLSPPPGLTYLCSVQYSLYFVLINVTFTALLLPIFVALLFFSTPRSRRTIIFSFNVLAVVLGIGEGILSVTAEVHDMLQPLNLLHQSILMIRFILCFYTPILVEIVLVLRLIAVFPSPIHGRYTLYLVLAFPVLVKIFRVVSVSLVTARWARVMHETGDFFLAGYQVFRHSPFVKMSLISQLFDNTYCSSIFIYRLSVRRGGFEVYTGGAIASRLRTVFLIAFSNYVFPTLLSLGQLILAFYHPSPLPTYAGRLWFILSLYFLNINNFVTILGVVFATVWTAGGKWAYVTGITEQELQRTMSLMRANTSRNPRSLVNMNLETLEEEGGDWQSIRRPQHPAPGSGDENGYMRASRMASFTIVEPTQYDIGAVPKRSLRAGMQLR